MRSTFEKEGEDYAFVSEIEVSTMDMWLEHCGVFVDECVLQINPEGFRVLAWDPGQVGMIDTTLYKEAFESHRAGRDGSGRINVGIILEKIHDLIDLMDSSDTVTMAFDQETGKIHLKGSGIKRSIALIDTDSIRNFSEIPDIDQTTVVTLSDDNFSTGFNSCDVISDHLEIGYNDSDEGGRSQGVYFYAEGDNDDNLYEPPSQQVHDHGPARTLLSTDYIEDIEKVVRLENPSGEVTIKVGTEVPAVFHINIGEEIGDTEFEVIDTTFCVAPRIEKR